jgi:hypothetical protein
MPEDSIHIGQDQRQLIACHMHTCNATPLSTIVVHSAVLDVAMGQTFCTAEANLSTSVSNYMM